MQSVPVRFVCVILTVTMTMLALAAANASPASPAQPQRMTASSTAAGSIRINYKISRFATRSHRLVAYGTAIARYLPGSAGGKASVVRKPFQARVRINAQKRGLSSASTTCSILTLDLQQLDLNLFGLVVHADRVFLTLTGDTSGGLLGNLLCGLANSGKLTTTAAKLSWAVNKSGLAVSGIGYTVAVQPPTTSSGAGRTTQSAATPLTICPVLELTLGPLDANLLGLVVHLDQVHLTLVADDTQGILGQLFCSVFNGG